MSVLTDMRIGETGILIALDLPESVQNYLMHMGFVPDAQVTALRRAPAGDPTVYAIDGMEIALRHETAGSIRVRSNVEYFDTAKSTQNSRRSRRLGTSRPRLISTNLQGRPDECLL